MRSQVLRNIVALFTFAHDWPSRNQEQKEGKIS